MRFLSDLLKPVAALPVVLGVLAIAGGGRTSPSAN